MGDSQAYPPARPFERLFSPAGRFRDDALEAVKQLKRLRSYDAPYDLHVRQILERAIRKQADQQGRTSLRPVFADAARLHLKAADCVDRVLRQYFSPPPVLREASELLRSTGEGYRRPSRPGRKERKPSSRCRPRPTDPS